MNVVRGWPNESSDVNLIEASLPLNGVSPSISGWPRGLVTSNDAESLLASAVGWWDSRSYRQGDRFWRNRGSVGEMLNFRLGSSVLSNSNEPLYIPVSQDGYVYLPGAAGNSVSCTSPVLATQFIAYPLDRSSSNTAGVVTGGSAFSFSNEGSWRRIELLDSSNQIVAEFDGDTLTGASITQTDQFSVTWSINRSTAGRKSVTIAPRRNGGRPCWLFGVDDYMEIPLGSPDSTRRAQNQLLEFDIDDTFSVVAVFRLWGNANPQGFIIGKRFTRNTQTGMPGYTLTMDPEPRLYSAYGTNPSIRWASNAYAYGTYTVSVSSHTIQILRTWRNRTLATSQTLLQGTFRNVYNFSIGGTQPIGQYQEMEFFAGAIFRQALTAAQMRAITTYYGA